VRRPAASRRAFGYQMAAPSWRDEAARAQARLWPAHPSACLGHGAVQSRCHFFICLCAGLGPVLECLQVVTRDAAPRRAGRTEPRLWLPNGCAARPCSRMRARVRAQACAPQRRAKAWPLVGRAVRHAALWPGWSKSETLTMRRRRGMPLAFHRTPSVRRRGGRMDLLNPR
jgi:hypothetical protein